MRNPPDQATFDEMNSAFKSGKIFDDKADNLTRYICALGSLDPNNQDHKTTSIIRALAINHIQMKRVIHESEASNKRTQLLVIILTIAAVVAGFSQVIVGLIGLCVGS